LGAALGAALGITAALIHGLLGGDEQAGLTLRSSQIVGAILVSITISAIGMLATASLTWPLTRWRAGRAAAVGVHALLAATFAGCHLTSSVLRALSGSFLTLGAVDFMMAGGSHLVHTIALGYGRWVLLLLVATALIGAAVAVATRKLLASTPRRWTRWHAARFAVPACVACAGLLPIGLMPDVAQASPEAAFAASVAPEPMEDEPEQPAESDAATVAHKRPPLRAADGPALAAGQRWRKLVRDAPRPTTNILLLTLESISVSHLGYSGYERDTTPNLDRIAAKSLRFRRAWSTATHSNYAQMAILSSLFPRRRAGLDTYRQLDYPRVLLHDVFSDLGYATGTISSQDESWQGMRRFQDTGTPTYFHDSQAYTGTRMDIGSELVVQDQVTAELAIDWIRKRGRSPWSLYVNFQATHFPYRLNPGTPAPYQPTETTRGRFNYLGYPEKDRPAAVNRYDNALHYVDAQIGKLERALDDLGVLNDTIWVITADHGESFHDHGQVTHGKTLFDTEARVPLLVHWPAKLTPADVEEPVSNMDVLPTLLDLLDVPPHPAFQGKSFASPSTRSSDPPAIYLNIQGLRSAEAIVCWPWKLIVDRSGRTTHLFDLERDPGELDDRARRDPVVADRLRTTLAAQIGAQMSYHKRGNPALGTRYAPRLLACPALPEVQRASASPEPTERPGKAARPAEVIPATPLPPKTRSN